MTNTNSNIAGLTKEEKISLVNDFIADNGLSVEELTAHATTLKVAETADEAGDDPQPSELSPLPRTLDELNAALSELQRRFNNLNMAAHDSKF